MSELGERFACEEMERDERMEMLIEDLGLEGPALEEYLRVHRQIEMELMMEELRDEEQFSSPAAQRTLDEIEKLVKNARAERGNAAFDLRTQSGHRHPLQASRRENRRKSEGFLRRAVFS